VKQRVILYLDSDMKPRDKKNRQMVLQVLKFRIFGQPRLFPDDIPGELEKLALSYCDKYLVRHGLQETQATERQATAVSIPPLPERADYHQVDINGLEVSGLKSFGAEHLCKQVLDKLGLAGCFSRLGMDKDQARKSLIAIAARAIFSSSEHKTAQIQTSFQHLPLR